MRFYLIGAFLGLISLNSYASDKTKKYQYEDFLNSSDRGIYLQEQIDTLESFKTKKCEKIIKFKQIGNDSLVLHLQAVCKGSDENLYLFLPKAVNKDLLINTCKEVESKPNMKIRCGESLWQ
jgi:hypothetical protein